MPVQRVTKYPLLLSRLYKVTPSHHTDKNDIKSAQDKIEAALEQMNKVSFFSKFSYQCALNYQNNEIVKNSTILLPKL